MCLTTSSVDVLTTIVHSLVVAQDHASVEEALQAMALSEVRRKMGYYYRRRIRALERKYDLGSISARHNGADEIIWEVV